MGRGSKEGGREMVLESRHVVVVFFAAIVLCGVFFTLGYVTGRNQTAPSVSAAEVQVSAPPETRPAAEPAPETAKKTPDAPPPSDWNFYRAGEAKKPSDERLATGSTKTAAPAGSSRTAARETRSVRPPMIAKGAIVLQVAALTREADALALAQLLQHKKFPAFVQTPGADRYYRVQVGPYADAQSADIAKRALEREGFKAITRR